jgi:hypothetical protein
MLALAFLGSRPVDGQSVKLRSRRRRSDVGSSSDSMEISHSRGDRHSTVVGKGDQSKSI